MFLILNQNHRTVNTVRLGIFKVLNERHSWHSNSITSNTSAMQFDHLSHYRILDTIVPTLVPKL
jgi:hypothetical protein